MDVEVIDPSQYLLRPSNADYKITKDFIVEVIDGDPMDLRNFTLNQEISKARGSVSNVVAIDSQDILESISKSVLIVVFQRDISVQGMIFGEFQVEPKKQLFCVRLPQVPHSLMWIRQLDSQVRVNSLLSILMEVLSISHIIGKTINQFTGVGGLNYC